MRVGTPIGTIGPHFVLPNRSAGLQRINRKTSRRKSLWAVRRADSGKHRALHQRQPTSAVQQRYATGLRPALTQLGHNCLERWDDLLVVGLVDEVTDTVAKLTLLVDRMVAHRATEEHNRSATWLQAPLVYGTHGQHQVGET